MRLFSQSFSFLFTSQIIQMKKTNIAFTKEQREEIIDMALGWYADWKHDEPTVYTETIEERKSKMITLNNSELIKHLQKWYALDIWDFIN